VAVVVVVLRVKFGSADISSSSSSVASWKQTSLTPSCLNLGPGNYLE
jgi:hypothetical protein